MRRLLAALLGLALMAGCGDDERETSASAGPPDEPWVLTAGLDVPGWETVAPSATFSGGTLAGSTGCNRYTTSYTVDGDALRLGPVATTEMACAAPADAVEAAFLDALERVAAWRTEGGELALLDAGGEERLRFAAATPAGSWTATAFRRADAVSSLLEGTEITAEFAGGKLSGFAGCNRYTAAYRVERGTLTIERPASTRKLCAEPDGLMEQEQAYLAALPAARSYRVEGQTLSLLAADGTFVATFERAP